MKNKTRHLICYLVCCVIIMILSACVQNEMSCTGIKTYQRCAHLCNKYEVTTCETSVRANKRKKENQYQKNNSNYQNRNNSNY